MICQWNVLRKRAVSPSGVPAAPFEQRPAEIARSRCSVRRRFGTCAVEKMVVVAADRTIVCRRQPGTAFTTHTVARLGDLRSAVDSYFVTFRRSAAQPRVPLLRSRRSPRRAGRNPAAYVAIGVLQMSYTSREPENTVSASPRRRVRWLQSSPYAWYGLHRRGQARHRQRSMPDTSMSLAGGRCFRRVRHHRSADSHLFLPRPAGRDHDLASAECQRP